MPFDLLGSLGNIGSSAWGALSSGDFWKGVGQAFAPTVAAGAVAGFGRLAFPGEPASVLGIDPRTTEMGRAENIRLNTASRLQGSLNDPFAGLSPEELQRIRYTRRAADAARGSLETGGSAEREARDVALQVAERRRENLNLLGSMTQGYSPKSIVSVPGAPSPWSELFSGLAPMVARGTERLFPDEQAKRLQEALLGALQRSGAAYRPYPM